MDHGLLQFDVAFTNFDKAFDRVDQFMLLKKLYTLGIQGDLFQWVNSFISNRRQTVVIRGNRSDFVDVSSGMPQGPYLGPLFYNAFLYDIGNCIIFDDRIA